MGISRGNMKNEIYGKFTEKALVYLENTEAFLKDQVPDYFQQVVKFYAIHSWVFSIVFLIGLAFFCFVFYKGIHHKKESHMDDTGFIMCFSGAVFGMIMAIFLMVYINKGIKATYAPKVFIVDYLKGNE